MNTKKPKRHHTCSNSQKPYHLQSVRNNGVVANLVYYKKSKNCILHTYYGSVNSHALIIWLHMHEYLLSTSTHFSVPAIMPAVFKC